MTHLHLLLHIVTLDIQALVVPWHQFIYSLLVPDGRLAIQPVHDSVLQVLIMHVVYQQGASSSSRKGESPMVPGPDCMEDGRMCPKIKQLRGLYAQTFLTF